MATPCNDKHRKENWPKVIKQELLASIIEIVNKEDYSGLNEEVKIQKASPMIKRKIINFWKVWKTAMNSLSSAETLLSAETFILCGNIYPVRRLLSSVKTFIQWGDFYPVWGLLSSAEAFIQWGEFYPVRRLLSSAETFIQCGDFYPVWKLLSSAETFIRWGDFYPVLRLLSSEKIFIQ